jgi:hypothetical protein
MDALVERRRLFKIAHQASQRPGGQDRASNCYPAADEPSASCAATRGSNERHQDRFGSTASLEASDSDFRYYPERRHSLLLQYLTKRANSGSGFPSSHEDGTQWAVRVIGIFVRVT